MVLVDPNDFVNHTQRFHGTPFQAITATCAECFIDRHLEIGVRQCPRVTQFLDHLQELATTTTTIAHKYEITGKIVGVVYQPGLLCGLQNFVAFLLGNPVSEFSLHHVVGYIAEAQARITRYVLYLTGVIDQVGVVAAVTYGNGE
jgi:hypothetical protein